MEKLYTSNGETQLTSIVEKHYVSNAGPKLTFYVLDVYICTKHSRK